MSASFRDRFGTSAAVLLLVTGWFGCVVPSLARSDDAVMGTPSGSQWTSGQWLGSGLAGVEPDADEPVHWFTIRVNALYLNRRAPASNIVLTESATGNTLLDTSANDPSWAGGTEVNFLMSFSNTTSFEFDWFSVDDWFDRQSIGMPATVVDQVPFTVTDASVSMSSRIRNMEFNLREEVYDGVIVLAGFRYLEFLDAQGVHYQNRPFGASEVISTNVANRMYGFQIGTQLDIYKSENWELSTWGKVGIYSNAADNSTGIVSTVPGNAANIRAQDGKTAFATDLAIRGTRKFGDHVGVFIGYRLMYLDGIALAANQYPGTLNYLSTAVPSIKLGNSMLFQGIEAGMSFAF